MEQSPLLTIAEISNRLKVNPETVRRWIRGGELAGISLGGRTGYRVERAEFEAFLRKRLAPSLDALGVDVNTTEGEK